MKKLLLTLVLVLAGLVGGCGLVDDFGERNRRYATIIDLNMRMAVDDFDAIVLAERNSYLTRWHPRVGTE
jgi:hypothetical protein